MDIGANGGGSGVDEFAEEFGVVSEAELPSVAALHLRSWRDAYRGVIPDSVIDARSFESGLAGWRGTFAAYPGNVRAVRARGRVLGFCCAGPVVNAERSGPWAMELYALHVDPELRGRGIGARMLRALLAEAGTKGLILWTLVGLSRSRAFYSREGGREVRSGVWRPAPGVELGEVAYAWGPATGMVEMI
jgi:ribosomal protein S18 acetylase RimI-like enzyme